MAPSPIARRLGLVSFLVPLLLTDGLAAEHRHGANLAAYDGAWMVSSEGFCTGMESGQVTILDGRIVGPNGAGRVSPGGSVRTISNANGVVTIGEGHISGSSGAGVFRQSNGCTGRWTAVRM